MLEKVRLEQFEAVPHLAGTQLMCTHGGAIEFSTTKPNVIVGENGAGKSALLMTLAIRFLAWFTGYSAFDSKYTSLNRDAIEWWGRPRGWGTDWQFMPGLQCETDNAPALYYRPGHIPGNEHSVTTAMMCGYFDLARQYAKLTDNKSSGQACLATMDRVIRAVAGEELPTEYAHVNWRFGREVPPPNERRGQFVGDWEWQAHVLKSLMVPAPGCRPLILMDEPEQSLDARAEARLWKSIEAADLGKVQIIVASHSVYPILHPERFHLIECEAGYAQAVRQQYRV